MSRCRSPAGCGLGFAARTGYEQVSFASRLWQFQLRRCRRPTRGRQSPRPLDPGLRPASPPLRGPFASSGFLTEHRDAPSLARSRLFATSLSLVLKSLIGSALQMASQPLAVISFFMTGTLSLSVFGIASGFRLSRQNVIQPTRCYLFFLCRVFYRCGFLGLSFLSGRQTARLCKSQRLFRLFQVGFVIPVNIEVYLCNGPADSTATAK